MARLREPTISMSTGIRAEADVSTRAIPTSALARAAAELGAFAFDMSALLHRHKATGGAGERGGFRAGVLFARNARISVPSRAAGAGGGRDSLAAEDFQLPHPVSAPIK